MAFPTTKEGWEKAGYLYDCEGFCRCGAGIEWWITPARPDKPSRRMPMSVVPVHKDPKNPCSPVIRYERISHFADCPEAASFRRKR